jgi:hypothetical protein
MRGKTPTGFPSRDTDTFRDAPPRTRMPTKAGVGSSSTKRIVKLRERTFTHVSPSRSVSTSDASGASVHEPVTPRAAGEPRSMSTPP